MLTLLAAALATAALTAHARIGEDPAACANRYGNPTREVAQDGIAWRDYATNGVTVSAVFVKNMARQISFSRTDDRPFSRDEFTVLLRANAGDRAWEQNALQTTTTADGALVAHLLENVIVIQDTNASDDLDTASTLEAARDAHAARAAATEAESRRNLEGTGELRGF